MNNRAQALVSIAVITPYRLQKTVRKIAARPKVTVVVKKAIIIVKASVEARAAAQANKSLLL
jgi:hypothetical protein